MDKNVEGFLDDSDLVGNVQGVVVGRQPHVGLLLTVGPATTKTVSIIRKNLSNFKMLLAERNVNTRKRRLRK